MAIGCVARLAVDAFGRNASDKMIVNTPLRTYNSFLPRTSGKQFVAADKT
jgi:hypothetical protein